MLTAMVKRPPRRLPAGDRRRQILDRALPEFAARGFAGTGTRELAAAAGVSEPILYRHFPGKHALFAAVLDLVAERLAQAIDAALASADTTRGRLQALADALPAMLAQHQDELRVLCSAAASHADAAQAAAARAAMTAVGGVLTRGLRDAGLRHGVDRELAAYFLLQIGLGSALLRPLGVRAVSRPGFGERIVELMVKALLPPGS